MSEQIGCKSISNLAENRREHPIIVYDKLLVHLGRQALKIDPIKHPDKAAKKMCDMIALADAYPAENLPDPLDSDVAVVVASGLYTVVQPEVPGVELEYIDEETALRIGIYLQATLSVVHPHIFGGVVSNPITDYLNRF